MANKPGYLKKTLIVLGVLSILSFLKARAVSDRYEELSYLGMEYLRSKYSEEMVIEDGYKFYDSVYTMFAYPKENEEVRFSLRYVDVDDKPPYFYDKYLVRCLEVEVTTLIDKIANKYYTDFKSSVNITQPSPYTGKYEELEEYYVANGRPLSLADKHSLKSIEWVSINVYNSQNEIFYEPQLAILNDIKDLDFLIEEVVFAKYASEDSKEYDERVKYILEDIGYKLEQ